MCTITISATVLPSTSGVTGSAPPLPVFTFLVFRFPLSVFRLPFPVSRLPSLVFRLPETGPGSGNLFFKGQQAISSTSSVLPATTFLDPFFSVSKKGSNMRLLSRVLAPKTEPESSPNPKKVDQTSISIPGFVFCVICGRFGLQNGSPEPQ